MAHRRQTVDDRPKGDFEQAQLGNIAYFEMGQSPSSDYVSDEEIGVPFLQGNAEFGTVFPNAQFYCSQPKKLCKPGDVLISVRAPVGDLNKADQTYVIGRGLAAVRFTDIPSDFGWHLLNYWAKDLDSVAQGTTFRAISKGDLDALEVRLPPLPEQRHIAEILDTADAAVRETERVIAKLRQVKQGLLHDLLTRGLDAHGHLRDLDQATKIPSVPFSEIAEINPPVNVGKLAPETQVSFVPMVDVSNQGYWENHQTRPLEEVNSGYTAFQADDILFAKITPCTENGKGAYVANPVNGIGFGSTEFHVLRAIPPNMPRFIYHWTRSNLLRKRAAALMIGSAGQQRVPSDFFQSFEVRYLDPEEQMRIVKTLDAHDARIRAEEAVLAKRRQVKRGLMDDLLTGRVRVF